MSWFSLSSNEGVSFNDLQNAVTNGVFSGTGTPIPATDELVTKADAPTYVNIDTSWSSYAALASNEAVTKADLVSGATMRTINWSFGRWGGGSGSIEVYVNFSLVASGSINGDGNSFNAFDGDSINVFVYSNASVCYARIVVDGFQVDYQSGFGFTNASYNFSVSGDHSIYGEAFDNS